MFKFSPLRVLALASVLAAVSAVPASAATKVNVRVEGSEATLFDGSVSVSAASLLSNTGEDRGSHQCNVAANGGGGAPAATPTSALVAASQTALGDRLSPIALQWYGDFSDFLVGSIGGQAPAGFDYWELSVNWKVAQVGGCGVALKKGDSVLWAVSDGAKPSLRLSAPNTAKRGRSFVVRVTNGATGAAIAGARVGGVTTDARGNARLALNYGSRRPLRAVKSATTRSNTEMVTLR